MMIDDAALDWISKATFDALPYWQQGLLNDVAWKYGRKTSDSISVQAILQWVENEVEMGEEEFRPEDVGYLLPNDRFGAAVGLPPRSTFADLLRRLQVLANEEINSGVGF